MGVTGSVTTRCIILHGSGARGLRGASEHHGTWRASDGGMSTASALARDLASAREALAYAETPAERRECLAAVRGAERALAAAYLNPNDVDWSKKTNPRSTRGDGKIDCWTVDIPAESTRWVGYDTTGNGLDPTQASDLGSRVLLYYDTSA